MLLRSVEELDGDPDDQSLSEAVDTTLDDFSVRQIHKPHASSSCFLHQHFVWIVIFFFVFFCSSQNEDVDNTMVCQDEEEKDGGMSGKILSLVL